MNPLRSVARRIRSVDPRLIDGGLALGCLLLTVGAVKTPWSPLPWPVIAGSGIAGSLAVLFWRRRPVEVSLVGAGAMALSGNPGPLLIGVLLGGVSVPLRWYPVLAVSGVLGFAGSEWITDEKVTAHSTEAAAVITAALLAVVSYLSTRRQLVASLRERAERIEAERLLRDERARAGERTRIAREMHDVLAHKVSLISLHAGGLEVNSQAEAARIEQGAALIRITAQEALAELRAILGVLRVEAGGSGDPDGPVDAAGLDPADGPGSVPDGPGAFADLTGLVESWTAAGATVTLHDSAGPLPDVAARTVYRLVQEGLTNANRHAPGSEVTVSVAGRPGDDVMVTVANGPGRRSGPADQGSGLGSGQGSGLGSGLGLVGLTERLRLVGGTLHSAADDMGGWRLEGRLPWPAGVQDRRLLGSSGGVSRDQGSAGRR